MVYPPQSYTQDILINITFNNDDLTWPNQPLELTEFLGSQNRRVKADLSHINEARIVVNVKTAGVPGAILSTQYSTDLSTWDYLDDSSGPYTSIDTTGLKVSSYINISQSARSDVYLRIVGLNGNGASDPAFGTIILQVR